MPIVIADKFGKELEVIEFQGCFRDYLEALPSYNPDIIPPFTMELNGEPCTDLAEIGPDDVLTAVYEPQGGVVAFAIIAVISAAYTYYTLQNLPSYQSTTESGESIYSARADGNKVSPNGVVRQVAGSPTIYPDLLTPAHVEYVDEKQEYISLAMSVGEGYFDIRREHVYIAETPSINYTSDIEVNFYEPGDDVSGDPAFNIWYVTDEVSDLDLVTASDTDAGDWSATYDGATIQSFFEGVAAEFPFDVGERFEITGGSFPGVYEVQSIGGASDSVATVTELEYAGDEAAAFEQYARRWKLSKEAMERVSRRFFTDLGAPSFALTSEDVDEWKSISGGVNWEGWFTLTPKGKTATEVEIDVNFKGLYELGSGNKTNPATVGLIVEVRAVGSTTPSVYARSFTASTPDEIGYTWTLTLPGAIEPEIRLRRVTPDSDSLKLVDQVTIRRIKALLQSPTSYPWTTMSVRMLGTNALASTAQNKINLRGTTRKLPSWDELRTGVWDLTDDSTKTTNQYSLNDPTQLTSHNLDVDAPISTASGTEFQWAADGLSAVVRDDDNAKFYAFSEAFNWDTRTYKSYIAIGGSGTDSRACYLWPNTWGLAYDDGSNFHLRIIEVTLTGGFVVALDENNITLAGSVNLLSSSGSVNGDKIYILDDDTLREYNYSDPVAVLLHTYDFSADGITAGYMHVADFDGAGLPQKCFVLDTTLNEIHRYDFGTAGDVTTLTQVESTGTPAPQSFQVFPDMMYTAVTAGNPSPGIGVSGYMVEYLLSTVVQSRTSRSALRFAGYMAWEQLGAPAATKIDWDAMEALDPIVEARGDHLDAEFVDETTLWEAIKIMMIPVYSEPSTRAGKLYPVRFADNSLDGTEQLYTPDLMLTGVTESASYYEQQDPDGVDVEYFSSETNAVEVVECRLPGDLGVRAVKIQATGVTDETRAWRLGMRERMRYRLKPRTYSFDTELDALNSNYGDNAVIASGLFASQCGFILDRSGSTITLDFEPEFGSGDMFASFRRPNGSNSGLYLIAAGVQPNQIVLSSPSSLDFTPITSDPRADSTRVTIGNADEWGKRVIIRDINPSEDSVSVETEEFLNGIYVFDNQSPS